MDCEYGLLLARRVKRPGQARPHEGRVAVAASDTCWCSDGCEFNADNGEKLRVTFALDCCDLDALSWVASQRGYRGDDVRDVMLGAVEHCFGQERPPYAVQWLSDNGSAYTAEESRSFAREIGLEPATSPVCSPQSNGMAESFVRTMKRDYIAFMPKPDGKTGLANLVQAFEHDNEYLPHSALGYRSPREFRR